MREHTSVKQHIFLNGVNYKNSIKINKDASALAKHSLEHHHFKFDNIDILTSEKDFHKRAVLEML